MQADLTARLTELKALCENSRSPLHDEACEMRGWLSAHRTVACTCTLPVLQAAPALIEYVLTALTWEPAEHDLANGCGAGIGYLRCRCDKQSMTDAREKLARGLEGK